jgi:hypothetical protein
LQVPRTCCRGTQGPKADLQLVDQVRAELVVAASGAERSRGAAGPGLERISIGGGKGAGRPELVDLDAC